MTEGIPLVGGQKGSSGEVTEGFAEGVTVPQRGKRLKELRVSVAINYCNASLRNTLFQVNELPF